MKTIFWVLIVFVGIIHAQNNAILPQFSNSERDSLKEIPQGYHILNTSTGCINYYFNKQWMEICGNCTPAVKETHVDSIIIEDGQASIFFSPMVEGCTYSITNDVDGSIITSTEWPAKTKILKENITYRFKCSVKSKCGEILSKDWSSAFVLKNIDYCKGLKEFTDPATKKTYELISVAKACWMKEYLSVEPTIIKGSKEVKLDNSNCYFTWGFANQSATNSSVAGQGVCPSGFHLPRKEEALMLIDAFRMNPNLIFFADPSGGYDFASNKVVYKEVFYLWTSESNSFILSKGSEPSFLHIDDKVGMPVRCVRN